MYYKQSNKAMKDMAIMEKYVPGARYIIDFLESDDEVKHVARNQVKKSQDQIRQTLLKLAASNKINWYVRIEKASALQKYIYHKALALEEATLLSF